VCGATPPAFDWRSGYPTLRMPVFARNTVATSQPLAAQAGLRMLAQGGNAIDAAIACAAALCVVEPVSCGLGSDAFAIVWDGMGLHGLNASGYAPAAWDRSYFQRRHAGLIPKRGWDAVTVPGAVAGWAALHKRFGSLPFEALLQPAINLAESGHPLAVIVQQKWANQINELRDQPGFAQTFMPFGRAPHVGEIWHFPAAGATLRRIAASAGRYLYEGETAAAPIAHAGAYGGSLSAGVCATSAWIGSGPSSSDRDLTACTRFRRTARASQRSWRSVSFVNWERRATDSTDSTPTVSMPAISRSRR
jgi:gamma-glutamyltranspeptidase/glutathione hydrolase